MAATSLVQRIERVISQDGRDDPASRDACLAMIADATPLVSELKSMNRTAYEALAAERVHVESAQLALDKASLEYEALLLEHQELKAQIDAHLEVERLDHDVLSTDDLTQLAALGEEERHAAHLARLQGILNERRKMETDAKSLDEQVRQLQAQSRLSHRTLVRLEQSVAALQASVQEQAASS